MCLFQSVTNGIKTYFVYFGVNKGGLQFKGGEVSEKVYVLYIHFNFDNYGWPIIHEASNNMSY